jgi:L-ascorbate metabolism protein UlaG (beta-lactamase superfamily)
MTRIPWTMQITLIGGPTALIEAGGLRILTDPAFDPSGSALTTGTVTLRKTAGPALTATQMGAIDVVLLSHDQHFDNLDRAGRAFLPQAKAVLTTHAGAARLGGNATGLAPWESTTIGNGALKVTAAPARHGPPGIEPVSGDVIGFVLELAGEAKRTIYVTGDTVWYEGVAEVARRFAVDAIVLFAGAAQVAARGPHHLTMNREDAIATARAFPHAKIFPVHHNGWEHFSENQQTLVDAFAENGLSGQLRPLELGAPTPLFE